MWSNWRSALLIVKPETVVAWRRQGFRLFWTWMIRRGKPGRPACREEAFPWDSAPRDLLRDRDRIFGHEFVQQVKALARTLGILSSYEQMTLSAAT